MCESRVASCCRLGAAAAGRGSHRACSRSALYFSSFCRMLTLRWRCALPAAPRRASAPCAVPALECERCMRMHARERGAQRRPDTAPESTSDAWSARGGQSGARCNITDYPKFAYSSARQQRCSREHSQVAAPQMQQQQRLADGDDADGACMVRAGPARSTAAPQHAQQAGCSQSRTFGMQPLPPAFVRVAHAAARGVSSVHAACGCNAASAADAALQSGSTRTQQQVRGQQHPARSSPEPLECCA